MVLLDKPRGRSSNQAMQAVRILFDARKAGHTGNLDPFATGMLPVCLGEATKTAAFMLDADKTYRATARLGEATTTGDPEGEQVLVQAVPDLDAGAIAAVLASFAGPISQVPPMFSALKHQGRPLYEYARQGITIEREARSVTIHELRLLHWQAPDLQFEVRCSKGTYVRTLAEDIARALGSCAHLRELRRLSVAPFPSGDMVTLDALAVAAAAGNLQDYLLPMDAGLAHMPVVQLDEAQAREFRLGKAVACAGSGGWARAHDAGGLLLGLGEVREGQLQPRRVMQI